MAILQDWRVSRGLGDLGPAKLDNKDAWGGWSTSYLIAASGLVVDCYPASLFSDIRKSSIVDYFENLNRFLLGLAPPSQPADAMWIIYAASISTGFSHPTGTVVQNSIASALVVARR